MAHSHADPSRPAGRHVRVPPARAPCPRPRHCGQAAKASVSARLVSLHRRADLGQPAPGGERRSSRRFVTRARQPSRGADAWPWQCRRRRHRRRGIFRLHLSGGERPDPAPGGDHGRRHPAVRRGSPRLRRGHLQSAAISRCCGPITSARSASIRRRMPGRAPFTAKPSADCSAPPTSRPPSTRPVAGRAPCRLQARRCLARTRPSPG